MQIIIKTKGISLNQALRIFIEEKIGGLEKFGKAPIRAEIEIGRTTEHHRKGKVFRAEVQLVFPGEVLRAEAERKDLRLAIVEVEDELQEQIKKYKNKNFSKIKRNQRAGKKELKLSPSAKMPKKGRIIEEGL